MASLPQLTLVNRTARRVRLRLSTTEMVEFNLADVRRATDIVPEDHPDYDDVAAAMRWFRRRGDALDAQQLQDYQAATFTRITVSE